MFYYSIVDPPENVLLTTNATTNKTCQGDVVSFTCSADAVPSAMSFQLFKDNVPMETSASGMWVKALSEGGMFHYKCVANNSIGSASSTNVNITVNGKWHRKNTLVPMLTLIRMIWLILVTHDLISVFTVYILLHRRLMKNISDIMGAHMS